MIRLLIIASVLANPVLAESPAIRDVIATPTGAGWYIDVTLAHPDTGWDHYADGWRIEDEKGNVLATRTLLHPHVNEQPFTRGLAVEQELPARIVVRASCNVDGWAATATPVEFSR
ncbi:hypothetical protein [Loktanella sp. R86503]|uniref:hypothetical protein n=1 Tax=Loktanella sp. R86503 TaxID=3093847 RepID=UPI0036D901B5